MKKSYYAIIPANVRYDKELRANAKLLYGEITALCNERGYCWANNSYFANLYEVNKDTISKWISELSAKGYVKVEMVYKEGTRQIVDRYIRINHGPIDEKSDTPIDEKVKDNNTSINTTFNNTSNKDSHVRDIFNRYLSKNIVQHQKITSAMRTAINARLKDYSFEQLVQVIDNYATVYHGDNYWFDTKYTLADLMRDKDVRKFIDDADPLKNFRKNDYQKGQTNNSEFSYDPAVDSF